jgi:hypothetical protein
MKYNNIRQNSSKERMSRMNVKKVLLKTITLSSLVVLGSGGIVSAAETAENAEASPNTESTPLQGSLGLSENGGFNPNPPSELNKRTEIGDSYFGIAYIPDTFDFGTVKLNDDIKTQTIKALKDNHKDERQTNGEKTFNVGVKDKRRETTSEWTLFAKLENGVGQTNEGMRLNMPMSSDNAVRRNINDGTEDFQPSQLTEQLKKEGHNEVTGQKNLTITMTDTPVMYTVKDQFINGVYDLDLGDVTISIPDASKVAAQTLDTKVVWTLSNTPTQNDQLLESVKRLFTADSKYTNLKSSVTSQELTDVENEILALGNSTQKAYNLQHFNKYAKGHLIHWDFKKSANAHLASLKLITNYDDTQAGLYLCDFFNVRTATTEDSSYVTVKLERDGRTVFNEGIDKSGSSRSIRQIEVKPGDILTITHQEGVSDNGKVSVYPGNLKNGYIGDNGNTLKYKVTDAFRLVPAK